MKSLSELAAILLPVLFVLLCVRIGLETIGPLLLPLVALAFVALVGWLWLRKPR